MNLSFIIQKDTIFYSVILPIITAHFSIKAIMNSLKGTLQHYSYATVFQKQHTIKFAEKPLHSLSLVTGNLQMSSTTFYDATGY
jgi:hypothetical protein